MTAQLFSSSLKARIQPLAVFEILDHYIRRNEGQENVLGTLLGTTIGGVINITSSFPAPALFKFPADEKQSKENEALGGHIRNMYNLSQKASPTEQIVGWYSTAKVLDMQAALTHNFYWGECPGDVLPILVTVDPHSVGLNIQCCVNTATLTVGEKALLASFAPINFELASFEGEAAAMRLLPSSPEATNLGGDLANLDQSIANVLTMLKSITRYVDDVVEGKTKGNSALGRLLVNVAGRLLPAITPEYLDKIFTDNLQVRILTQSS